MSNKICVVGAGRWGKNHIKTLDSLGCLGGIVDSSPDTLAWFKEKYPGTKTFASLQDSLSSDPGSSGFDGYVIATPAETHFEIAKRLLHERKPLLVEKPLALKADQARELHELAAKLDVPLMVGHVMLFHPAVRKMRELISNGKLGKLQYLYSNRLNLGTVRTEENILWSFAPHDISIFQYLIGKLPQEVVSRGGAFVQPHIHDTTMTVLSYPDNVIGHIFVSWLHPFKEHRIVAIGSKGMLSFDDSSAEKHLLYFEKGIDWVKGEPVSRDGATDVVPYDRTMPLTEELRYFLGAVGGEKIELADSASAVGVLEILERASLSLLEHRNLLMGTASEKQHLSDNGKAGSAKKDYFVHPSSFIDDNVTIGEGTKIWHFSHVQPGSVIGKNCSIGQNVNVANNVRIGNSVKIQNNVSVYEGVELEDFVFCGPSMVFTNVLDPRSKYPQRGAGHYVRTLVREGASIGANATIVCGHMLGRHCFIAAGAVVTKDVPDFALMAGVPAKQIGWICECGQQLGKVASKRTCERCGLQYELTEGRLVQMPKQERAEKQAAGT